MGSRSSLGDIIQQGLQKIRAAANTAAPAVAEFGRTLERREDMAHIVQKTFCAVACCMNNADFISVETRLHYCRAHGKGLDLECLVTGFPIRKPAHTADPVGSNQITLERVRAAAAKLSAAREANLNSPVLETEFEIVTIPGKACEQCGEAPARPKRRYCSDACHEKEQKRSYKPNNAETHGWTIWVPHSGVSTTDHFPVSRLHQVKEIDHTPPKLPCEGTHPEDLV